MDPGVGEARPIRLQVTIGLTHESPSHSRPGAAKHELANLTTYRSSLRVIHIGIHAQRRHPQGKLVECVRGAVYDAVVDLRRGSPTFGRAYGVTLSDAEPRQLWIPPGLAHGFCVLSDEADFLYKCTDVYRPDDEGGLAWDDPDLGIPWPVERPLLSDKDRRLPRLRGLGPDDLPQPAARSLQPSL